MRPWLVAAMTVGLASAARAPAASADAAVARPRYQVDREKRAGGTVFFLAASDEAGAVAVGAAHSFDLAELARADEVTFVLGHSERRVAVSSRFYTEPGYRSWTPIRAAGRSPASACAYSACPR
jgi:hypothetical protein